MNCRRQSNISEKRAIAALTSLLYGCKKDRLATFTGASLAASYNVPLNRAEALLAAARQGRLL